MPPKHRLEGWQFRSDGSFWGAVLALLISMGVLACITVLAVGLQ
jgi:hypothetical protein